MYLIGPMMVANVLNKGKKLLGVNCGGGRRDT